LGGDTEFLRKTQLRRGEEKTREKTPEESRNPLLVLSIACFQKKAAATQLEFREIRGLPTYKWKLSGRKNKQIFHVNKSLKGRCLVPDKGATPQGGVGESARSERGTEPRASQKSEKGRRRWPDCLWGGILESQDEKHPSAGAGRSTENPPPGTVK